VDEGWKWQLVAVVGMVALAVFAAVRFLDRGPEASGGEPVRVSRAGREASTRARRPALVVHVAGAVRRPGVYRLAEGTRVAAAIARAGGASPRADLTAVNLAAPLADGQQVIVPSRVPGSSVATIGAGEGPISLASASADDLAELDGIGETIAERIVEYRTEHGGLRSIDELGEVDGIGEKRLEALKDELRP
jgi:competence protein ComEA